MRMCRAALNLTQERFANDLGITQSTVMRNEKLDVAVRGDTLVRMLHIMAKRGVDIDVVSKLDEVVIHCHSKHPEAAAMRMTRAALELTQAGFAEVIGVTKPIVTRGERDHGGMSVETLRKLEKAMHVIGILIDQITVEDGVRVTITREALERIEDSEQGSQLEGEPQREIVPYTEEELANEEHLMRELRKQGGRQRQDKA